MNIILDRFFENNAYISGLKENLSSAGFNVAVLEYIPFIKENLTLPDSFISGDEPTFVYGTIMFVKKITEKYKNVVAFFNQDWFAVSNYLSKAYKHKELFLNQDAIFTTYGIFENNYKRYFKLFNSEKLFIRPDTGNKLFTGLVVDINDIEIELNSIDRLTPTVYNSLISVSSPKEIRREYRTIIIGSEVVSASQYLLDGALTMSLEVPDKVYKCAKEYAQLESNEKVDDYVVCDVAELKNGDVKIIELNALSTSDLYMCDPKVLKMAADHYLRSLFV